MNIGIDVTQVIYGTGVSLYTKRLVEELFKLDTINRYILFGGSLRRLGELNGYINTLSGNFSKRLFPIPPTAANWLFNYAHFPKIESFIGNIDVFHTSDWTQPPSDAPKVATVHDLVPVKFPKLTHPVIASAHGQAFKWIKKEAKIVIAVSESTKKDLIDLGVEKGRIRVVYEAADEIYKPQTKETVKNIMKKYKISGNYLISVGVGARKNTERLISAYEKVRAGENLKLVFVGRVSGRQGEERGVLYLGHVPTEDLPALYSGAKALVYPSLYEGFGLPIVQAFACETPVVTSNISSMPEIASGAAILVDPYEVDSISKGIQEALGGVKELTKKGKIRAKDFSWGKTAKETLKVYQEAAGYSK